MPGLIPPGTGPSSQKGSLIVVANYATQPFSATLSGANIFVDAGAKYDSITDASVIALWSSNFTTTAPVAGAGNITGVLAGYLTAYPKGPQV